jgi:hypothetical protein
MLTEKWMLSDLGAVTNIYMQCIKILSKDLMSKLNCVIVFCPNVTIHPYIIARFELFGEQECVLVVICEFIISKLKTFSVTFDTMSVDI